ncbi:MAG TPA: transcription termination factor Rho, partial [Clostridia bacterium]|nr:transcription termination factor Rho [Clostridia bacterium]
MSKLIYTNEELGLKNIFELRDLAKDVGIPSPTKLHKNQLIELIINITSGAISAPAVPRRGRPPKLTETNYQTENLSAKKTMREEAIMDEGEIIETGLNEQTQYDGRQAFDRNNQNDRKSNYFPKNKQKLLSDEMPTSFAEPRLEDEERQGMLDIHSDGYGFLRVKNCEFNDKDVYVNAVKLRKLGLRNGDMVKGITRQMQDGKPAALLSVQTINGVPFEKVGRRPNFDELIPIYPEQRLKLELADRPKSFALRCIDLVAPIGKGQRAMIVSPPKAGKTTLLKMIAAAIAKNYPNVVLKVLLIDERPEEVTDMQRSIDGEVIYSTFDEQPEHHTRAAELLLANAKRLVEMGKDVVILMDSLTRLARAYNMTIPPTGRTLSGGIDPGALHSPKKFFGAARNIENGGSLTIIATALVDTGSRMDDVIYEEFKGTGNMEIHLDRKLQEKRVFPAIDLAKSGTRKEELLLTQTELEGIWSIRKILSAGDTTEATENLLNMIVRTNSNQEFIEQLTLQQ